MQGIWMVKERALPKLAGALAVETRCINNKATRCRCSSVLMQMRKPYWSGGRERLGSAVAAWRDIVHRLIDEKEVLD